MRSINTITIGAVVSTLLIGTGGVLFWVARSNDPEDYRQVAGQVLRIQQLASDWSVETARTRSDPLADYDALAAFIPQMRRLKDDLVVMVRGIPAMPNKLANDVSAYVSALDAKEERIERFKTANSVIRNSVRFLPVVASSIVQHPAADTELAREVSSLAGGLNEYASAPTDATKGRLTAVFDRLVQRAGDTGSVPDDLADALVGFTSHAQVLLDRQAPTEEIFQQATASDVSDLSNVLVADLSAERRQWEDRRALIMNGVWGVAAALLALWIVIAILRTGPSVSPRSSRAPETSQRVRPSAAAVGADVASGRGAVVDGSPDAGAEAQVVDGVDLHALSADFEKRLMAQRIIVETVAGRIAAASGDLADDANLIGDGDEKTAGRLRERAGSIADLAGRLAAASVGPEVRFGLVNLNACVAAAVRATRCESVAAVTVEAGEIPDLFACPTEICLMLEKVLENSAQSIGEKGLDNGKGEIRIATEGDGAEATVTVIDNGVGMTEEVRERMFEPLYAAREGGAGTGLTIAAHVVAKYSGRISVSSHAGAGAVTRIVLPGMADQ